MKKLEALFLPLLFIAVPLYVAWAQEIPALSTYKQVVLFLSVGAFGLMIGQFWLSRLVRRGKSSVSFAFILRWHKAIGYVAGAFLFAHPVLMIARRFQVKESDPFGNLMLLIRAPVLLPAIFAWGLLVLIVILALVRSAFTYRTWRVLHGLLSMGFLGLATWHVVEVGRHSNQAMSALWIALAAGAVATLLYSYLPIRSASPSKKGVPHGSASGVA